VSAAHNGAHIQILILDPESRFAEQRALDLGYKDGAIGKKSVQANISELERITSNHGISKHIEVRTYDLLPSMHIYSADDISFLGVFWHGAPSKLGYGFEVVGSEDGIGVKLHQEFERVWELGSDLAI
jgi:hypothetical protein